MSSPTPPSAATPAPAVKAAPGSPAKAPSEGGANRRRSERTNVGRRGVLHEIDQNGTPGVGVPCEVADISRSGIGVRLRKMIYDGRTVIVFLGAPGRKPMVLYGSVQYSRYGGDGSYQVGIKLGVPPTADAFQRWIARQIA